MKTSEIMKLLERCSELRITELEVDGLKVKFASGEAAQIRSKTGEAAATPDLQELAESADTARVAEIVREGEDTMSQLQIDDPVAYEEMLIHRELEERGSGGDENTVLED